MRHESLTLAYAEKGSDYYKGIPRADIILDLPNIPLDILEIGCGAGATLELARAKGRVKRAVGIEIDPHAARLARHHADEVIEGNIEHLHLQFSPESFDVLIISEVLEHLIDPWAVLKKMFAMMRNGGLLYASSPNVAHIAVLRMILKNQWAYEASGHFDWTHLR